MVMPTSSCQSVIIVVKCSSKIRVIERLLQWVVFISPVYCFVACIQVVLTKIS